MAEIPCKSLPDTLRTQTARPAVVLVGGEEYLCRQALEQILAAWMPAAERTFNCTICDGRFDEQIISALEQVNTYAMLAPVRIIVITDAPLVDSKANPQALVESIGQALDADDQKAAAAIFLRLLSRLNLTFEDCQNASNDSLVPEDVQKAPWFRPLIAYCQKAGHTVPENRDMIALLLHAVENGFPEDNHLILLAGSLDKRSKLYKTISQVGLVVNCEVPRGERKADKEAQAAVLQDCINEVLKTSGKRMDSAARKELLQLTGFDPRLVVNNLEKLISYIADRPHITAADVQDLLQRTRKDPIFELTGAVSSGRLDQALFFARSLLADNLHPLQLVAAIINQVRRLLLAREFLDSPEGRDWKSDLTYAQFQKSVFPLVTRFDEALDGWLETVTPQQASPPQTGRGSGSKRPESSKPERPKSDLLLGKTPYPVYLLLQNAARYTKSRLIDILKRLQQADVDLKSTARDPQMILEDVLLFMMPPK